MESTQLDGSGQTQWKLYWPGEIMSSDFSKILVISCSAHLPSGLIHDFELFEIRYAAYKSHTVQCSAPPEACLGGSANKSPDKSEASLHGTRFWQAVSGLVS